MIGIHKMTMLRRYCFIQPLMLKYPNPDLQIQYSIPFFVKLYLDLDCIYGIKLNCIWIWIVFMQFRVFGLGLHLQIMVGFVFGFVFASCGYLNTTVIQQMFPSLVVSSL